ncbi:MAG: putative Ig domain-containing protein, partial [Alphaproteobacteria bacterium]|nr:putative Ig domain-containing protein [Alphaproteobacteria bacterium]
DIGDTLTYAATLSDGSALPGWLSFDPATLTFTGTPENDHVGAVTVRIIATDIAGASATADFVLDVANVNDAPTVLNTVEDQFVDEDAVFTFTFPADIFEDVDAGDTLVYTATRTGGDPLPSWLTFDAATRTFSGTPENDDVGVHAYTLTATDAAGASVSTDFSISVINTNDAPVVSLAPVDRSVTEDTAFSFTLPADTFVDIDAGDTLTYTATLSGGAPLPAWLAFDAATQTFSGTPPNADIGAHIVSVTATDGAGASASANFTLNVARFNNAPAVLEGIVDQSVDEDSVLAFAVPAGTFGDIDAGDVLTYTAALADGSALPAWLSFDALTQTFSGTPANDDVGEYSIRVTATDTLTASVSTTFTLTVANTNDAPIVANAIENQVTDEDALLTFVVPEGTFSDIDAGDVLTYTASLADGSALPQWLSFDPATRTFSGVPENADVGVISVRVVATDIAGATASTDFVLEVANVND